MKTNSKPFLFNYKEALCNLFDKFISEGHIESGHSNFYDVLKDCGNIDPPKKEVIEACRKAMVILLKKDSELPVKLQKPYLYNLNSRFMVKRKAKTLLLEDIFAKIDAKGKHLKDYLI